MTQLTLKIPGRLLILGDNLDNEVNHYVKAVLEAGGVITTAIIMASAAAIVRRTDRNLLSGSGQYNHQLGKISSIPKGLHEKKREYVSEGDCC